MYKKGQSRLHFLRRLRSVDVCGPMLHAFCQSVVASTLFFAATCWGSGMKTADANNNKQAAEEGWVCLRDQPGPWLQSNSHLLSSFLTSFP